MMYQNVFFTLHTCIDEDVLEDLVRLISSSKIKFRPGRNSLRVKPMTKKGLVNPDS